MFIFMYIVIAFIVFVNTKKIFFKMKYIVLKIVEKFSILWYHKVR